MAVANGSAWIHSWVVANINVGTVVTVCTIAVPALCGAVVYTIKNVGPAWLGFLSDRDKARSAMLSGQMAALMSALKVSQDQSAADARLAASNAALAEVNARRADGLSDLVKTLTGKVDEGNAMVATMTARVNDANAKLHEQNSLLNGESLARQSAELELRTLQTKLDAALAQAVANGGKMDSIGQFGSRLADAGNELAHAAEPKAP